MVRTYRKRTKPLGLPPGSLVHVGEKKIGTVKLTLMDYDQTQFQETIIKTVDECFPFKDTATTTWINVDGLHDVEVIKALGERFAWHPLVMEDILNTEHRPKLEDFGDYLYAVLKMLQYDVKKQEVTSEQISVIIGPHYVVSFQEREGDVFDPIRDRIRTAKGRTRSQGSDYLAYSLIDAIVDHYFVVMDLLGEQIDLIEEELVTHPEQTTLRRIHRLKRETTLLRKSVWPLRELIRGLERDGSALIAETTAVYMKDVYDHVIDVVDTLETYREVTSGMLEIYISSISNRTNEVMKVLTIIATIFIPLTFIVGVYGMNFNYMPELGWRWGYFAILSLMTVTAGIMLIFFRRKKWI